MSNFEDNGTDYTVAVDAAEFREVDISTGMFLLIAQKDGKEKSRLFGPSVILIEDKASGTQN